MVVLLAVGCASESGRSDIAAEAGIQSLDPERLAAWIARVPGGSPARQDAERAALVWVDYSLLAQALGEGRSLTDSATIASAVEPDRILLTLRLWHDSLAARRPPVPDHLIDSLFSGDSLRVFQHLLFRLPDRSNVRAVEIARARVDSALTAARAGADFTQLARARSEDVTAADGGFLPVARRGTLLPELERVVWQLAPGAFSLAVSRVGLHLVHRPPLEVARTRVRAWVDSARTRRADSLHADSLRTARRFVVDETAADLLRRFFDDPSTRAGTAAPVASWENGWLALRDAAFWIDLLPPGAYLNLKDGSDLALEGFVRDVALQRMLLEEAIAQGVRPRLDQLRALSDGYLRGLREARALLGLRDDSLAAPGNAEATGRVSALLEGLAANRVRWRPLPSGLGALLREERGYRLHRAGLVQAVEAADTLN